MKVAVRSQPQTAIKEQQERQAPDTTTATTRIVDQSEQKELNSVCLIQLPCHTTMGVTQSKGDAPDFFGSKRRPETSGDINARLSFRMGKQSSSGAAEERLRKTGNLPVGKVSDDILSKSTESTTGSPEMVEFSGFGIRKICEELPPVSSSASPGTPSDNRGPCGNSTAPWFHRQPALISPMVSRDDSAPEVDSLPPAVSVRQDVDKRKKSCSGPIGRTGNSLPVKCPRKNSRRGFAYGSPTRSSSQDFPDHDEVDNEHLQQMYDLRTWDMYIRITEARKASNYKTSNSAANTSDCTPTRAEEHFPPVPQDAAVDDEGLPLPPSQLAYGYFATPEDPASTAGKGQIEGGSAHEMIFDLE